ncbi:radical SAM protein [Paenibacillus mucilaginosus]|uniref:Radical SAM domain-containing protein n=3 Tax=Paenibacillus mucilaginosus TaxID=61624 RepID=H6NBI5_9BACL|nr:radical SAM protein [Paenibacillus mucilaginosus]AEI46129.1 radical SAM domain-containing protein [Paenibacillus mucilaginosus KNP414]AFC33754.1 radical SAM domain-containing protein [Paenibacillus mucilaginosus 3016]AFH66087.1 radical SAM protein [Paenibacillus mucilaginosus K02]MCG7213732.1 radical SAM protein [Paenibacillus mucilaginosus]WDM27464.1 radical SAM protein [Paenibacillus mucilaginosus]
MNLVYADLNGNVYDHPDYTAVGRSGEEIMELFEEELIPLPEGATLVSLPDTRPIGIDSATGEMKVLPGEYTAVGALLPQSFTRLMLPGYAKADKTKVLPLFGYTAVVWKDGGFYVAAEACDDPERWNPKNCDPDELEVQVKRILGEYSENRLYQHLSNCALGYECLTASNTFLGRWEGAVPVSFSCNAGCFGCISEQPDDSGFPAPQTRMNFKPTVDEVVQVMLEHLKTPQSIISFGQGCEGEPSTQAKTIIEAMREVRSRTDMGYININTNAGLTDHIRGIVDAGLDLMRVSTISALDDHYNAYYKPRGYTLKNVEKSLRYAADKGVVTSINYLIFPGVTDREEEMEAMIEFVRRTDLKLIQLRNLNIDPESYLSLIPPARGERYGMKQMLQIFREELPGVVLGSYTHIPDELAKIRKKDLQQGSQA